MRSSPLLSLRPLSGSLVVALVATLVACEPLPPEGALARLTNTGDWDAHNVRVLVGASTEGSPIPINGADPYIDTIGTVPAGNMVERKAPVHMSLGPSTGLSAERSGIDFTPHVLSHERTKEPVRFHRSTTGCK